jgi:hypothetical protein
MVGADEPFAKAHEAVTSQLYNPASAIFRNDAIGRHASVCGEVDSRNREGGRTGFARYVFDNRNGSTLLLLRNPDFHQFFVMDDNEYTNGNAALITDDACRFIDEWNAVCTEAQVKSEKVATSQCKLYRGGPQTRARLKRLVGGE